jgi:hypothetical protein
MAMGGDDDFGSVVGDAFVEAGGQAAELFEASEAAFDDVAAPIEVQVEAWWPPPTLPLALRLAIWSARSGQVNAIPRARRAWRVEGCE